MRVSSHWRRRGAAGPRLGAPVQAAIDGQHRHRLGPCPANASSFRMALRQAMWAEGRPLRPGRNPRTIGQRRRLPTMRARELLAVDCIDRAGRPVAAVATGLVKPIEFGPGNGQQLVRRALNFAGIDGRAVVVRDEDRRGAAVQGDCPPSFEHRRQGSAARAAERIKHQFSRPRKMADILANRVVRFLSLVVGMHGIDGGAPGCPDCPGQRRRRKIFRRVVGGRPTLDKSVNVVVAHGPNCLSCPRRNVERRAGPSGK